MKENNHPLGYLIWEKIPQSCLEISNAEEILHSNNLDTDPGAKALIRMKGEMLSSIGALLERSIYFIRTGISWAEWDTPGGKSIITWHINECLRAGLDILPNLAFTAPRLGIQPTINSPPRDPLSYVQLVLDVCSMFGNNINKIEHWNEWNLVTDWQEELDPEYDIFTHMIAMGALVAKHFGKMNILGGMAGVRDQSLIMFSKLIRHGLMHYIDVVGFHNLRGTWSDSTPPPDLSTQGRMIQEKLKELPDRTLERQLEEKILASACQAGGMLKKIITEELENLSQAKKNKKEIPLWLTEYGFPTFDPENRYEANYLESIQTALFADALEHLQKGVIERVYWYTLKDKVSPSVRKATTGLEDILQYYYGDTYENGKKKLLAELLLSGGVEKVIAHVKENNLTHLVKEASIKRNYPFGYTSQDRK